MFRDSHHVLFTRHDWESRPPGRQLRSTPSLIVNMERSDHDRIHRTVPAIPVPSYNVLIRIARNLIATPDTLETMDNMMFATEEAIRHPKAHDIERALGNLTIEAIELQRPFIYEAMEKPA